MSEVSQRAQNKLGENLWEKVSSKGDKTYFWTPRLPDPETGKTKTVWVALERATNRTEAKAEKDRMIEERGQGKVRVASKKEWKALAEEYLADQQKKVFRKENPRRQSTIDGLVLLYRLHVSYFEKFGLADNIKRKDVEDWIVLLNQHLGYSSIKQIRGLAARIYKRHVHEVGGDSPFENLDKEKLPEKPKRRKKKVIIPRPEEFFSFIAAIDDEDLRFVITLIAFTGMRVGEALGLQRDDVDLEAGTITVRHQLYRGELIASTKTAAGDDRVIPLLPFLAEALEIRLAQVDDDFLSVDEDGLSFPAWQVRNHVMAAAKKVGREHTTTHHLRHWFISTLSWAGVPIHVIKEIVGHEDDDRNDVTKLVYTHPYSQAETFQMVHARCAAIGFGSVGEGVLAS